MEENIEQIPTLKEDDAIKTFLDDLGVDGT